MELELRYTVLKNKDIGDYLTRDEQEVLDEMCQKINSGRVKDGRRLMKCVVIERDWPEYEPVLALLEKRMDMKPERPAKGDEPRFTNVYCSNCGREFGPGDHGFSHCDDHKHLIGRL